MEKINLSWPLKLEPRVCSWLGSGQACDWPDLVVIETSLVVAETLLLLLLLPATRRVFCALGRKIPMSSGQFILRPVEFVSAFIRLRVSLGSVRFGSTGQRFWSKVVHNADSPIGSKRFEAKRFEQIRFDSIRTDSKLEFEFEFESELRRLETIRMSKRLRHSRHLNCSSVHIAWRARPLARLAAR